MSYQPTYLCPDCGWEGDEPICPSCTSAAERVDGLETSGLPEKYPEGLVDDPQDDNQLDDNELAGVGSDI